MVSVKLIRPLQRGETTISTLELREPNAGALRGVRLTDLLNGDVDAVAKVLPRISDPAILQHEIVQLGAADLAQISGEIMGFFMPPETDMKPE